MESTVKPKAVKRPTTCSGLFAAGDTEHAEATCKRLPRHKGDHRATLHVVRVKSPKASRKASALVTRREFAAALAVKVESGKLTATEALSRMSAYAGRARRSSAAVEPVTESPVQPMKAAQRSRVYLSGRPAMRRPAIA
jgi:hypothetical protein